MKFQHTTRIFRLGVGALVAAGSVVVAAPAHATTTARGATTLMTCDNVVWSAKFNDPITKAGLNFTTHDIKVTAITHPETNTPSPTGKLENDINVTPDVGDTDSCSGLLTTNFNQWVAAGSNAPYSPSQGSLAAPINEIVKISGALTGRGDCDGSSTDPSSWALHGKLIIAFGNQASVGSLATPQLLTNSLAKVGSQIYITSAPKTVAPIDLNNDNDVADPGETVTDLVDYAGIVVKGTGEGAFFDETTTSRAVASQFTYAAEACGGLPDLNNDSVIGAPPFGGLQQFVTDTDVDTDPFPGAQVVGNNPAYNNSIIFSI